MSATQAAYHAIGRIGPNAITRIVEALVAREGAISARRIFRSAGLEPYLSRPPTEMVDEHEVTRLHRILHDDLGSDRARTISRIAGQLTAEYLLAYRIPRLVKIALRCLPAAISSRILTAAIARNAWTFVGTGTFSATHGRPTVFTVRSCPICNGLRATEPYCDFYAATFEHLYSRLVKKRSRVREISCQAMGADECSFIVDWRRF